MEQTLIDYLLQGQKTVTIDNVEFTLPVLKFKHNQKRRVEEAKEIAKRLIKTLNS